MSIGIVYATMGGSTEQLASFIKEYLIEKGIRVELKEAFENGVEDILQYEYISLGSYTWGDGDVADEMQDIYDTLETMDLTGKTFGVFGSGDTCYEYFAGAVDMFEEMIQKQGGYLAAPGLKADIELEETEIRQQVNLFTEAFLEASKVK